jgi:hypothetical protein
MEIDNLLKKLAKPAQRAILGTGVTTVEQLSTMSEDEIFNLHGIGKNAMKVIVATLWRPSCLTNKPQTFSL